MKVIVVHVGDILKYPPVVSLINGLENNGVQTVVITTISDFTKTEFNFITFEQLGFRYEALGGPLPKLLNIFKTKTKINELIFKHYNHDSVVWVTYNVSLKHMDINKLYKYRYVMQLMELTETIKYHEKLPFKLNAEKIARNAVAVVVPEYNRAHITKAWWDLQDLPFVLPNKPYYGVSFAKHESIDDPYASEIISKLKNKKIILYQGILSIERPLDVIIKAVDRLGDDYAFVVMSGGENIYKNIKSRNYYFIPFVAPPGHLQITSNAYIGVMAYIPVKSEFSKLNVLYCAPNKTYEYGMFGIPMIGNDLPGLQYLFETKKCGKCFSEFKEESIIEAIRVVEDNYTEMSHNAKEFYDGTNYNELLVRILEKVNDRIKVKEE